MFSQICELYFKKRFHLIKIINDDRIHQFSDYTIIFQTISIHFKSILYFEQIYPMRLDNRFPKMLIIIRMCENSEKTTGKRTLPNTKG